MENQDPNSKQICVIETSSYYITGAAWNINYYPSYEIGIRAKEGNFFTLIQNERFNEGNIKKFCEYVEKLLPVIGLDGVTDMLS